MLCNLHAKGPEEKDIAGKAAKERAKLYQLGLPATNWHVAYQTSGSALYFTYLFVSVCCNMTSLCI